MKILKELWNGNLNPKELEFDSCGLYAQINEEFVALDRSLRRSLNEEQLLLLERHCNKYNELMELELEETFLRGFRMGGQIILAILEQ